MDISSLPELTPEEQARLDEHDRSLRDQDRAGMDKWQRKINEEMDALLEANRLQQEAAEQDRREIDRLREQLDKWIDEASKKDAVATVYREQLVKAQEALRTLAFYYDLNDCHERDDDNALEIPIRDLKAAKAALPDEQPQANLRTGECNCLPWPDKCPYCGGQPSQSDEQGSK